MKGAPHDPQLTDQLAELSVERFQDTVYRATRLTADPTAFSTNGGRWAPPSSYQSVPVLYTSLARDGALAEMAAWLSELSPRPTKPVVVHTLRATIEKVVRLDAVALGALDVTAADYALRNYARPGEAPPSLTQQIGAALSFLGFDGLIVPSARWPIENLIIFDNQAFGFELEAMASEQVDWIAWHDQQASKQG